MKEIKITKEFANQRVDKYVRKYLGEAPLSFIYKLFRKKDVKINGHRVKENYILNENDVLRIYIKDEQLLDFKTEIKFEKYNDDLDIIYEDKNILVVNKEEGILVHGDDKEKKNTLSNKVINYLHHTGEFNNENGFIPSPVHRLDRNTSGVIIFAKNVMSSQLLMDAFKEHDKISKVYLGLVFGKVIEKGKIDAPLKKDETTSMVKITSIKNGGKEALTYYEPIVSNEEYSLLKINLVTGRTHQIRVHLSSINYPLVGDAKYGNFEKNRSFAEIFSYNHQFLHAKSLTFFNLKGELSYLNKHEFIAKIPTKKEKILNEIYTNISINNL